MQVMVLRWDPRIEDLTDDGISVEMVDRIRAGLLSALSFSSLLLCLFQYG